MSDEPKSDLGLIARQQRNLLNEMGEMRDDMRVMMAILQRLDGKPQTPATSASELLEFALSGRANRTLRSTKTGTEFAYL